VKILYFAWVRQKIGVSQEELRPPASVTDVSGLIDFLKSRGEGYAAAFHDLKALRVAVNQQHSGFNTRIGPDDEIAFFPPVTGG
jgi:sulfur-carrier protein